MKFSGWWWNECGGTCPTDEWMDSASYTPIHTVHASTLDNSKVCKEVQS